MAPWESLLPPEVAVLLASSSEWLWTEGLPRATILHPVPSLQGEPASPQLGGWVLSRLALCVGTSSSKAAQALPTHPYNL